MKLSKHGFDALQKILANTAAMAEIKLLLVYAYGFCLNQSDFIKNKGSQHYAKLIIDKIRTYYKLEFSVATELSSFFQNHIQQAKLTSAFFKDLYTRYQIDVAMAQMEIFAIKVLNQEALSQLSMASHHARFAEEKFENNHEELNAWIKHDMPKVINIRHTLLNIEYRIVMNAVLFVLILLYLNENEFFNSLILQIALSVPLAVIIEMLFAKCLAHDARKTLLESIEILLENSFGSMDELIQKAKKIKVKKEVAPASTKLANAIIQNPAESTISLATKEIYPCLSDNNDAELIVRISKPKIEKTKEEKCTASKNSIASTSVVVKNERSPLPKPGFFGEPYAALKDSNLVKLEARNNKAHEKARLFAIWDKVALKKVPREKRKALKEIFKEGEIVTREQGKNGFKPIGPFFELKDRHMPDRIANSKVIMVGNCTAVIMDTYLPKGFHSS